MVKCLGVSHRVGSLMSYWVITANITVVSRTTVSRIINLDTQTDDNKESIAAFYKSIQEGLKDKAHIIVEISKGKTKDWCEHPLNSNPDFQEEFNHIVFNE